jgi:hypothetical protein
MQRAEVVREAGTVVGRNHWRELLRNPALVVWVLFLLLSPLYVVSSGLPQPGDWLVLLLLPVTLFTWNGSLDKSSARMIRALIWFTVWVFLVNYGWALILGKWTSTKDFIIHPFFYFFNSSVFLCALIIARKNREAFLRVTVEVVFFTIVVQVVSSFFVGSDSAVRGQVFFNSPNQLGYYALLSACLFAMVQRPLGISRLRAAVGMSSCAYLALLSASRSSVAGILILLLVLLFSNPRTIIIASLAVVGLVSLGGPVSNAIEHAERRVTEDRDPRTTFAQERGYDRIWNSPEYLLTGAGEGAYERFVFRRGEARRELHSSFGTMFFGYGVIGLGLFVLFGTRVIRGAPLRMSMMLVPSLIYTIAHQGLRFTMFWVVLAAFVVLKPMPDRDKKLGAARVPANT